MSDYEKLAETEKRLVETTADDALVAKLQTDKGVGLITAVTLRAEIGRFDRFRSGKQLARFCGFSPRNASSGERVADAGLVKAINPQLRATLLQSVHCLSRYDERWSALRSRLLLAGKPKNVATAAVGNRWLRWLYHEMKPLSVSAEEKKYLKKNQETKNQETLRRTVQVRASGGELEENMGRLCGHARLQIGQPRYVRNTHLGYPMQTWEMLG